MKKIIVLCVFMTVLLTGVFGQDKEEKEYTISRSMTALNLGMGFDSAGNKGFTFMIKSSSSFGDLPLYMGFTSLSGSMGTDAVFESGLHAGVAGPLFSNSFGGDAYFGLNFGGRVDTVLNEFKVDSPSALIGAAISFPYQNNWDISLHFNSFIRPYTLDTGKWDFSNTYFNLYLSLNLKDRTEGRSTNWSEGLKN